MAGIAVRGGSHPTDREVGGRVSSRSHLLFSGGAAVGMVAYTPPHIHLVPKNQQPTADIHQRYYCNIPAAAPSAPQWLCSDVIASNSIFHLFHLKCPWWHHSGTWLWFLMALIQCSDAVFTTALLLLFFFCRQVKLCSCQALLYKGFFSCCYRAYAWDLRRVCDVL